MCPKSIERISEDKMWNIIQGLPVTRDTILAELPQTYRCVVATLRARPTDIDHSDASSLLYTQLHRTLTRVMKYLGKDRTYSLSDDNNSTDSQHKKDQVLSLLQECVEECTPELVSYLGLVTLAVLLWVRDDIGQPSSRSASLLNSLLHQIITASRTKKISTHDEVLIFSDSRERRLVLDFPTSEQCKESTSVSLRDLVNLHLGLVHLGDKNFSKSDKCLSDIRCNVFGHHCLLTYAKAYVSLKIDHLREAKLLLATRSTSSTLSEYTSEKLQNLFGCILSEEEQHNAAISAFQTCIRIHPSVSVPLYNLSLQYRKQAMADEELETLKALIAHLSDASCGDHDESLDAGITVRCSADGMHLDTQSLKHVDMTLPWALYLLASRCKALERFDLASQYFLQVLDMISLKDGKSLREIVSQQEGFQSLPATSDICLDYAFCLLHSQQLDECISACDKILDQLTPQQKSLPTDSSVDVQVSGSSSKSKKRPHSESMEHEHSDKTSDIERIALMYKSDALFLLQKYPEAILCLDRIINIFEHQKQHERHDNTDIDKEPATKRTKVEEGKLQDSQSSSKVDESIPLSEVYSKKAVLLMAMEKEEGAIEISQLAMKTDSESDLVVLNHCLIHLKCGKGLEASKQWLKHRKLDHIKDRSLLQLLLKQKAQAFDLSQARNSMNVQTNDKLNATALLNMDIISIKNKLQIHQL